MGSVKIVGVLFCHFKRCFAFLTVLDLQIRVKWVRRNALEAKDQPPAEPQRMDPNIRALQDDLSQRLGAKVQIQHGSRGKGKLVLNYNSLDELDGILAHIK